MKKRLEHFGVHLMMDMYNCDSSSLNDKDLVENILNDLPEKLGMHKLIEPCVVYAQANGIKDPGGWSGFVMIQESHISIHTFIKRRFVTVDVYSCREFDTKMASNYFQEAFKTTDVEVISEKRGLRYPDKNLD